jgi:uncharacterized nucleotidyltransferase DUF6036
VSALPDQGFLDALAALRQGLDDIGTPSMIIGGVAVIALGIPRLTVDIDATLAAARLVDSLARQGITPRIPDAVTFARQRHVFLGVHEPSGTPVDVSLAWLPFEEEALRNAQACDYAGVHIRIPRPEDLLIYKLIAARPRDLEDAEGLLVLYGNAMDLGRVRTVLKEFAALIDDVDRPLILERLIAKVGPEQ